MVGEEGEFSRVLVVARERGLLSGWGDEGKVGLKRGNSLYGFIAMKGQSDAPPGL